MWKECSPKVQASTLLSIMVPPSSISKSLKSANCSLKWERGSNRLLEWERSWGHPNVDRQTCLLLPRHGQCHRFANGGPEREKMNVKAHSSLQALPEPPEAELVFSPVASWDQAIPYLGCSPENRFGFKCSAQRQERREIGYTTRRQSNLWV